MGRCRRKVPVSVGNKNGKVRRLGVKPVPERKCIGPEN